MGEEKTATGFWSTIPGVLTAIAGLITAVAALVGAFVAAGVTCFHTNIKLAAHNRFPGIRQAALARSRAGDFSLFIEQHKKPDESKK